MNIISNVNQSLNKIEHAFLQAITIFIVNKMLDCSAKPAAGSSHLPHVYSKACFRYCLY